MAEYIRFFETLSIKDVPLVGGKNASLGEMYSQLSSKGVLVPNGFATTSQAYNYFMESNKIDSKVEDLLKNLNVEDVQALSDCGHKVRDIVQGASFPEDLAREIIDGYVQLSRQYGDDATDVAIRSSATAEDLPDASFAGQQETYLNIRGHAAILDACRKCFASLFTDRAIAYRKTKGYDTQKIALSIGVQKMVRSDLASSGVMFTIDTESGFRDAVLISASYGLGENIVRGVVNPDEFYVFKPTLRQGFRPIIGRRVGSKEMKMIYDTRGGLTSIRSVPVPVSEQNLICLSDDDIIQLAKWAVIIEDHYS
ncbi:MAG: phosphoenolpyruvate synthase, partial [Spirochaetia bacterium]|nr:phosphoenolpyruvate synthase [Spirochaetia bacterium]